jgi:hypothetical protein
VERGSVCDRCGERDGVRLIRLVVTCKKGSISGQAILSANGNDRDHPSRGRVGGLSLHSRLTPPTHIASFSTHLVLPCPTTKSHSTPVLTVPP